jgi:hypothetical protein
LKRSACVTAEPRQTRISWDRNGKYCGRGAAILYSAGGIFACRHCHDLSYGSQNETPRLRRIRRVRKIRMRLGAGFSFAEPFPEKMCGMHWGTYRLMRAAANATECGSVAMTLNFLVSGVS